MAAEWQIESSGRQRRRVRWFSILDAKLSLVTRRGNQQVQVLTIYTNDPYDEWNEIAKHSEFVESLRDKYPNLY